MKTEEIENGITELAKKHAKQSVGDWAVGYLFGVNDKEKLRDILRHYEIFKAVNGLNDSGRTYENIIDEYLKTR